MCGATRSRASPRTSASARRRCTTHSRCAGAGGVGGVAGPARTGGMGACRGGGRRQARGGVNILGRLSTRCPCALRGTTQCTLPAGERVPCHACMRSVHCQGREGIRGNFWFTEADLRNGAALRPDKTGKGLLMVLRHLGRLSEVGRAGQLPRAVLWLARLQRWRLPLQRLEGVKRHVLGRAKGVSSSLTPAALVYGPVGTHERGGARRLCHRVCSVAAGRVDAGPAAAADGPATWHRGGRVPPTALPAGRRAVDGRASQSHCNSIVLATSFRGSRGSHVPKRVRWSPSNSSWNPARAQQLTRHGPARQGGCNAAHHQQGPSCEPGAPLSRLGARQISSPSMSSPDRASTHALPASN
jgi:hypothetical protein